MVWFSAWRSGLGPTWYGDAAGGVVTDFATLGIFFVFAALLGGFALVFPGLRRRRLASLGSVGGALAAGALLLASLAHPAWRTGSLRLASHYRSFSAHRLHARLGLSIGLAQLNITLQGHDPEGALAHQRDPASPNVSLDYNERFDFTEVRSLKRELAKGLRKGLPYPMLSVIEYLSVDRAGFVWGREYRLAGYYTAILLWLAFGLWVLAVLLLGLAPELFSRACVALGAAVLTADCVYFLSCPTKLAIPFHGADRETHLLTLSFGWCFWATLAVGLASLGAGLVIRLLEAQSVYTFATFLEPLREAGGGGSVSQKNPLLSSAASSVGTPAGLRWSGPPHGSSQAASRTSHWLRFQCLEPQRLRSPNEPASPASPASSRRSHPDRPSQAHSAKAHSAKGPPAAGREHQASSGGPKAQGLPAPVWDHKPSAKAQQSSLSPAWDQQASTKSRASLASSKPAAPRDLPAKSITLPELPPADYADCEPPSGLFRARLVPSFVGQSGPSFVGAPLGAPFARQSSAPPPSSGVQPLHSAPDFCQAYR